MTVGTFNVRTLALNGKNVLGHAEEILKACRQKNGCNIVGFQKTRRDGQNGFTAAGHAVYCSGSGGGMTDGVQGSARCRASHQGVDLAGCGEGWTGLWMERISARLMKVRLILKGSDRMGFHLWFRALRLTVTNRSETKTSVGPH